MRHAISTVPGVPFSKEIKRRKALMRGSIVIVKLSNDRQVVQTLEPKEMPNCEFITPAHHFSVAVLVKEYQRFVRCQYRDIPRHSSFCRLTTAPMP